MLAVMLVQTAGSATARLVTTDEVLTEVLNWFSRLRPVLAGKARPWSTTCAATRTSTCCPKPRADFDAALALYEARPDKEYSLTDCRSMVALRALGVSEVLTNDHHFTQEGFTILFP